jgi:hypothetical protein
MALVGLTTSRPDERVPAAVGCGAPEQRDRMTSPPSLIAELRRVEAPPVQLDRADVAAHLVGDSLAEYEAERATVDAQLKSSKPKRAIVGESMGHLLDIAKQISANVSAAVIAKLSGLPQTTSPDLHPGVGRPDAPTTVRSPACRYGAAHAIEVAAARAPNCGTESQRRVRHQRALSARRCRRRRAENRGLRTQLPGVVPVSSGQLGR